MAYYFRGSNVENPFQSVWAQFFLQSHLYILNPRGTVSSFKTLEMRDAQSLVENLTNVLNIRKSLIKGAFPVAHFFQGSPKINEGT